MTNRKLFFRLFLVASLSLQAQQVKIMSYNIKYDNVNDTVNNWNDRKEPMVQLLQKYSPSFIGMQEVLYRQLNYLNVSLPDYDYIGVGRDDGKQKGEFSPILYDTSKFTLLQSNTFWLSKTPDKISVGWDAAMERICTYGLFENKKTKEKLWVFNTHFDHIGTKARKKSAKLILKKTKEINTEGLPVVLMGDFNLMPEQKPIQLIQQKMKDALSVSATSFQGPTGTFNGFDTKTPMTRRIDYVFVKDLKVDSLIHIDERLENGKHISDHLPVLVSLHKN
jgi:endonuclease/exonuclease/phosphatase family metal-dependent hydrolase